MSSLKPFLLVTTACVLLSGCSLLGQTGNDTPESTVSPATSSSPTTETSESVIDEAITEGHTQSAYQAYDAAEVATAAETGTAVLFFHASWCPTCRAAEADIEAKLDSIPENVTIFKVDYDTATALKKQYGITSQHTFVIVDQAGNEVEKWNGGDLEEILERVG